MPKLRRCSGMDLVAALRPLGFVMERQHGSHIKLVRTVASDRQVLIIPNHKVLDTGTIRAIARQSATYLTDDEVHRIFYTE